MSIGKRKSRELAMQVLFSWDVKGDRDAGMAQQMLDDADNEAGVRNRAMQMAEAAWLIRQATDEWVIRLAPQWPTNRQPGVDRALLRLAVWELTNTDTPPKVVIDEAIEMAKQFSTEQSPAFINGVLDAVLKEHQKPVQAAEKTIEPQI
jgi:N utilization substance protein B